MEDDLKIGKVEHLSKHSMDFDWLEENSEEILSVALLSPACFTYDVNKLIHFQRKKLCHDQSLISGLGFMSFIEALHHDI